MTYDLKGSLPKFNLTVERIEELTNIAIVKSQKRISEILRSNTKRTPLGFKEIVKAIDSDEGLFRRDINPIILLSDVAQETKIRNASRDSAKKARKHSIAKWTNVDLYKVFKTYSPKPDEQSLWSFIDRKFKEHGTHLKNPKREEAKKIKKKTQDLAQQFQRNINEDKTQLVFSKEELNGLPGGFFKGRLRREDSGKYVVNLKYPDYYAIMSHAKNAKTRKKVNYYFLRRGAPDNSGLLMKIARLRQEEALLLGFSTYSDYALKDSMAKTPENARGFLRDLKDKIHRRAQEQLEWIKRFKGAFDPEQYRKDDGKVYDYDLLYYSNLLAKEIYGITQEETRRYFPLKPTIERILRVVSCIFSISFEEVLTTSQNSWAPDVVIYNVYSAQDTYLGKVYLDLLARPGKFSHYATFPIAHRFVDAQGKRYDPAVVIIASFPARGFSFDELKVFFHEFGHVFHQLFSATPHFLFAGTNLQEEDFVEAPSQLVERLLFKHNVLRAVSAGKLPMATINKIYKAHKMTSAIGYVGKIIMAELDLRIYNSKAEEITKKKAQEYWGAKAKEIGVESTPGTDVLSTFDHIVFDYASTYYGYFWSLVCAISMFRQFGSSRKELQETSNVFRQMVLAPGGSLRASEMYLAFMNDTGANLKRFRIKEILEEINI